MTPHEGGLSSNEVIVGSLEYKQKTAWLGNDVRRRIRGENKTGEYSQNEGLGMGAMLTDGVSLDMSKMIVCRMARDGFDGADGFDEKMERRFSSEWARTQLESASFDGATIVACPSFEGNCRQRKES